MLLQAEDRARAVIVTGGARGIGLAIARRLAAGGARVALWDREGAEAAARTLGSDHLGLTTDVTCEMSLDAAAAITWASFRAVDGLVCNAGILGPVAPLWEHSAEEFRKVLDVNLVGCFLTARACVPRLLAQPGDRRARIVNIASIQGKEGLPQAAAYAASKAGVMALTKTLGKELALHGIPVNCITPAVVETDMATLITPERRAELMARIPMGRFLAPDEVAAMAEWLLSQQASFSTGAAFDLSGGRATY